jgi:6-bladed beta-propeller
MTSQWTIELALCAGLLCSTACSGAKPGASSGTVVRDSAGVLMVQVGSLGETGGATWSAKEEYSTQAPDRLVELYQVSAARFLDDGRLAVANSGTHEILVIEAGGTVDRHIGRQGEGPGEFSWISTLDIDTAGHLVAYDPRLARITSFTSDGQVIETRPLSPPSSVVDLQPLAYLEDRNILAVYGQLRVFAPEGEHRDSTPLMRFDSGGTVIDTLGVWPAREWVYLSIPQGSARTEMGYGRTLAYAGSRGVSVLGATDSLDLLVYDRSGHLAMRITGGGPNPAVSQADVAAWRKEQAARLARSPAVVRTAFAEAPYRTTFPAFDALATDDRGRVWIGGVVRPGQRERKWIVLKPDGTLAGTLLLPGDARILDIAGDRLATLRRNDVDEEYVVVLRLQATG